MDMKQEIDEHEQELQALLARVLNAPLAPLFGTLQHLNVRVEQLAETIDAIRNEDVPGIKCDGEDLAKRIKKLAETIEITQRDMMNSHNTRLDAGLTQLGKSQESALESARKDLGQAIQESSTAATVEISKLAESQAKQLALKWTQMHEVRLRQTDQIGQDITAHIGSVRTHLEHRLETLDIQFAQLARVQAHVSDQMEKVVRTLRRMLIGALVLAGATIIGLAAIAAGSYH